MLLAKPFGSHRSVARRDGKRVCNPGADWGYRRLATYGGFAGSRNRARGTIGWLSERVTVSQTLGSPETTAQVHPAGFTIAMMRAAEAQGAERRPGRVTGLAIQAGRVTGVEIDGATVAGDAVVIAMGPWSILAAAWLPLPAVFGLKGHSLVFETGTNQWRRYDSWPPKRTEPKALYLQGAGRLAFEPPAESGPEAFDEYLVYRFVPSPGTFYANAWKVPPGHLCRFSLNDLPREPGFRQFEARFTPTSLPRTPSEWEAAVRDGVVTAVKRQLMSDVPLGVLLSGGVDSTVVTDSMRRALPEPPAAFAIGFRDNRELDELGAARAAAGELGVPLIEVAISEADYLAA